MVAPIELTAGGHPPEMRWNNTVFVPVVPPTKKLIVWRIKDMAEQDPRYIHRSSLFAKAMTIARDNIESVLPATKEEMVEAVLMDDSTMEGIRTTLGFPKGVVGFPYKGRYIYNHVGDLANAEGGFEMLTPDKQRAAVHELTHLLKGMNNLPYWIGEGFCEALPRFLLGYHDKLQTTSYLQDQFENEIVDARALDEENSLFAFSTKFPFGENRAYMSSLAYVLGLSSFLGNADLKQGLVSFYDMVHNSTSSAQLQEHIDKISSTFATGDRYSVMNQIQKRGVELLKKPRASN